MPFSCSWLKSGVIVLLLFQRCVDSHQEILLEESAFEECFLAPAGGEVELPCDVTPAQREDRMALVIWYKQGHTAPIYTLDTREGVTSHWADPGTLGPRASFRSETQPAILRLTKLRPEDSGQYRCRVDFIRSPTKNTRLNLTVMIPPERLIVLNHEGNEVRGGVLGPYDEGSNVNLTCVAVGGRPPARLSWWKSHSLLANSESRATTSLTLQRSDYGQNITCQAVTDQSIPPMAVTLSIDVILRPLWVRLQGGKRPLIAGQSTELVCQAVGARPKPSISWWKGGTRLKTVQETTSTDGNVTNSILTFVPAIEDAGRVISCRAVQPTLLHSTQEDGWKMEIQHFPMAKLELGANLDPNKVVEGSDVYLDCKVQANPGHHHIFFTHNGYAVKPGPGVLLANQSLVLQKVSRRAAGAYVCLARNALGEGSSEKFMLDVKYVPTCATNQPAVYRASRGELIQIVCSVDANPREPMSFYWWFNSSAHTKQELHSSSLNAENSMPGTFIYMVNSSADYGWVQCSGTNSVGKQIKPCLYHILPADKPSSVKGCEITNVTYESLTFNCTPGYDGGIQQNFLFQVVDVSSGLLLYNITKDEPELDVSGLPAASTLSLSVRAVNKKGPSETFAFTASLLKYPQRHVVGATPLQTQLSSTLLTVLVVAALITAATVCAAAACCCRRCAVTNSNNGKSKPQQDESSNILMPLNGIKEAKRKDSLEKNPDIIPVDGQRNDNCSSKSSTTECSSVRPLIPNASDNKYSVQERCNNRYTHVHNTDDCNQYFRALEYAVEPNYQTSNALGPPATLGPSVHSLSNMSHMPHVGLADCHVQKLPYDRANEDWLKYNNMLPMNMNGLIPMEQATTQDSTLSSFLPYSNLNVPPEMPELKPRYHLECGPQMDCKFHLESRTLHHNIALEGRSCSNSPSVPGGFSSDGFTLYLNKDRTSKT